MTMATTLTGSVNVVTTCAAVTSSCPDSQPPSPRSRLSRTRLPCASTAAPPASAAPQPIEGSDCPAYQPGTGPATDALPPIPTRAMRSVARGSSTMPCAGSSAATTRSSNARPPAARQSTRVAPPTIVSVSSASPKGRLAMVMTASSPSWTVAPLPTRAMRRSAGSSSSRSDIAASRCAACGAGRAFATAPTALEASRVTGAMPTAASVRSVCCAARGTSLSPNWVRPTCAACTDAGVGAMRDTDLPRSATVVPPGRSSATASGAPSSALTSGAHRRGAGRVRSTTTGVTGGDTGAGLVTRSSASEPKVGEAVRSPRNAATVVRPVPPAAMTSAARSKRRLPSGLPSVNTFAALRKATASVTRASVCTVFVTNGSGLRRLPMGSSIWW